MSICKPEVHLREVQAIGREREGTSGTDRSKRQVTDREMRRGRKGR